MVSKQKILIVDDDVNIAELISLYLTKECYDTQMVHDGEEALQLYEQYAPNLILLDLMLPGIDGPMFRSSCSRQKEKFSIKCWDWSWERTTIS